MRLVSKKLGNVAMVTNTRDDEADDESSDHDNDEHDTDDDDHDNDDGVPTSPIVQVMADDAVFINTSRGICLDEQALIAELAKGRLFAFLDVSAPEPAAVDSPLRTLPNVVYTSHLAVGKDGKIGRQAVDDIAAFLAGGQPLRAVTADKLDRMA
jgi:hypothetical protein